MSSPNPASTANPAGVARPFARMTPLHYHEVIARFGDSVYLYDMPFLRQHGRSLRDCLPRDVDIIYSVKANPNVHLIQQIRTFVQGVEVSSEGELAQALAAGLRPEQILLIGPAKAAAELEFGVRYGVRAIVVESEEEYRISSIFAGASTGAPTSWYGSTRTSRPRARV